MIDRAQTSVGAVLEGCAPDPCVAYAALSPWHPFALLESASLHSATGKRTFLGLGPRPLYRCKNARGPQDLLQLQQSLDRWRDAWISDGGDPYGIVFAVFAYEWKNALEVLPQTTAGDLEFPDAWLAACRDLLVWDHAERSLGIHCTYRDGGQSREEASQRLRAIQKCLQRLGEQTVAPPSDPHSCWAEDPSFFPGNWKSNMSRPEFLAGVRRMKGYIAAGDIYQANLSQRFQTMGPAQGLDLYARLRQINPSPFSGFVQGEDWELISCSPERLICKEGNTLQTRPIAGTRPRGVDSQADGRFARELFLSPKERSEHIMLVDLERNDLGRVCEKGTVRADEIMTLEKYSHVQHIVSNVTGTLRPQTPFVEILRAVFPGGTITGVPKIRCMQILDEIEPTARGPYTGSFGYLDSRGDFDLNIAIRTILKQGEILTVQAGAGIVADSDPAAEYQETLDKAKAMALAVELSSAKIPRATISG